MTGLEIRLASRNVLRQGIRSAMPLTIVAVAVFVIVVIGGFYQYLFDSLEDSVVKTEGHFWIVPASEGESFLTEERLVSIREIPNVRIAAPRSRLSGVLGFGERSSLFSGIATDPPSEAAMTSYPRSPGVVRGDSAKPGVKLGSFLAEGLGVPEGEWVSGFTGNRGFSAVVTDFVRTASEDSDRFFLELPYEALGGIDYGDVDSLHLQVRDVSLLETTVAAVASVFPSELRAGLVFTVYSSEAGYVSSVRTIYGNNLIFIMTVLAVTVFFAIAAAFTLSMTERTQELGTLRSFGAQQRHLALLFRMEALFLSLYGFALGLALALLGGFIVNSLGGIEIPPPPTVEASIVVGFVFQPFYALAALGLVILVGQVSSFVVTRRIGSLSVVGQLGFN